MWVQFTQRWQDGLYKYQKGMKVEIPTDLAVRYIDSGKAKRCKPPEYVGLVAKDGKQKEVFPSARRRIKKTSSKPQQQMTLNDIAENVFED